MAFARLVRVAIAGAASSYEAAEDAVSALKCMEVARVERGEAAFVIEGWIPEEWAAELAFIVESGTQGRATLVVDDAERAGDVDEPVELANRRYAKPFEMLVELFALPTREGFDPTLATSLALPLFFGLVVGDFGYGLALVVAGLWTRWRVRTPLGRLASTLLVAGGAWAALFGAFLFGDVFAFQPDVAPFAWRLLDKTLDVTAILALAVAVGLAHLALGLGIGFAYEKRRAGLRAAILRKASWLVLEAGLVLLALGFVGVLASPWRALGVALALVAVLLLALGGGIVEVIEVPGFVGNALSYLRLGALGLADGYFGASVNAAVLHGPMAEGLAARLLGVAILVAGHALMLALSALVATLHAVRLHYVEFYPKFYDMAGLGRARPFVPTRIIREGS